MNKNMLAVLMLLSLLLSLQSLVQAEPFGKITEDVCEVCNADIDDEINMYCKAQCPSECYDPPTTGWRAVPRKEACDGDSWTSCCWCGTACEAYPYGDPDLVYTECPEDNPDCIECSNDGCFVGWGEYVQDPNDVVPGKAYCRPAKCCEDSECGECETCNAETRMCEVVDNGETCESGVCIDGVCDPDACNDIADCTDVNFCTICDLDANSPTAFTCVPKSGPLEAPANWCNDDKGVCIDGNCVIDIIAPQIPIQNPYQYHNQWVRGSQTIWWSNFGNPYDIVIPGVTRTSVWGCYCINGKTPGDPFTTSSNCYTDDDCVYFASGSSIYHTSPINEQVRFRLYDPAGNWAPTTYGTYTVKIDNQRPVTSYKYDGQTHGDGYTVDLECDDGGYSGCQGTFYCVYNEGGSPCNPTTSGNTVTLDCKSGPCSKIIRYYSTDVAGNSETPKDSGTISLVSDEPSCVMGDLPESSGSPVNLSWSGTDPFNTGIREFTIQYSVDGGAYQDWQSFAGSTTSGSFTANQEVEYSFQCKAKNNQNPPIEGRWSGVVSTTADLNPPSAITQTPAATGETPFNVSCAASDSISTTFTYDIQWSADGSSWQGWVTSSDSSTHTFGQGGNPATVDDGDTFYLRCRATDNAGHTGEWSQTNSTLVDSAPPNCTMGSMNPYHNTTTFQFAWSSPDTDAVSYDLCINTDGSACTAGTPGYADLDDTSDSFTGSNGNTYHFSCRAIDMAGNTGEWSPFVSTTIDTTPPALDDSHYTNVLTSTDYEDLIVNITVSDEAGIGDVSLVLGGEEISPTEKSGSSGDTEWVLVWEIPYSTYMGSSVFTITITDVGGNSDSQDFSYSISDCNVGETRECNPVDPSGNAYTQGVCKGTGNRTCQADGTWSNCTGGTLPTSEDCNNLDDDCDGEVDEGLNSHPCGPSSDLGICRYGTSSCSGGAWTTCIGAVYPMAKENCNNDLDDDCNGIVNDVCVCEDTDPPIPCGESNVGICSLGEVYCVNGQRSEECIGAVYSTTEQCDNTLDDDCDGLTDCDDSDCLGSYHCEGDIIEPDGEPFPWWWLSVIGIAILVVLVIVWYYFKSQGEELTWETLKDKWTPLDWK